MYVPTECGGLRLSRLDDGFGYHQNGSLLHRMPKSLGGSVGGSENYEERADDRSRTRKRH